MPTPSGGSSVAVQTPAMLYGAEGLTNDDPLILTVPSHVAEAGIVVTTITHMNMNMDMYIYYSEDTINK